METQLREFIMKNIQRLTALVVTIAVLFIGSSVYAAVNQKPAISTVNLCVPVEYMKVSQDDLDELGRNILRDLNIEVIRIYVKEAMTDSGGKTEICVIYALPPELTDLV